jgi:hypothetical protein
MEATFGSSVQSDLKAPLAKLWGLKPFVNKTLRWVFGHCAAHYVPATFSDWLKLRARSCLLEPMLNLRYFGQGQNFSCSSSAFNATVNPEWYEPARVLSGIVITNC